MRTDSKTYFFLYYRTKEINNNTKREKLGQQTSYQLKILYFKPSTYAVFF